jgi:hypothetical protein
MGLEHERGADGAQRAQVEENERGRIDFLK